MNQSGGSSDEQGTRPSEQGEFIEDRPPEVGPAVPSSTPFDTGKWREITRAGLAISLTVLLATVLLIIVCASVFSNYSGQDASNLLGIVLAPLVGLVGAATGFYYGKEK